LRGGCPFEKYRGLGNAEFRRNHPVESKHYWYPRFQQQETDLVVIVTAHLVAPSAPGQRLASPLDSRLPSNDVDFFLNGQPEVRKHYTDFVTSGADLVGPYGHIIAPDGANRRRSRQGKGLNKTMAARRDMIAAILRLVMFGGCWWWGSATGCGVMTNSSATFSAAIG
jgi:hypothetical protein